MRAKMRLNREEMDFLVKQVTREVKKFIGHPEVDNDKAYGTVALVADILPSPKKAFEYIKTEYGMDTEVYFLNDIIVEESGLLNSNVKTDADKAALMKRLAVAKSVLLICPSVGTLKRLEEGNDDEFSQACVIRAILWKKDVNIILDFEPPTFKRGTLFEKISSAIDSLTSMGVKVNVFRPVKSGNEGKLRLVTENEIKYAHEIGEKTVLCEKNVIVTPLARDTAKELKINIEYAK
jgi:hypothetical protein